MVGNIILRSVVLTNANQNYVLSELLAALSPNPFVIENSRIQAVQIQWGDDDTGAVVLFIGNPLVLSGTDYGVRLVATQAHTINSLGENTFNLSGIALRSDGAGFAAHIEVITR